MNRADQRTITIVKLKVAEYIVETMADRGITFRELSEASCVSEDTIRTIVDGKDYIFGDLLALFQVLRIHLIFETSTVHANIPDEMKN